MPLSIVPWLPLAAVSLHLIEEFAWRGLPACLRPEPLPAGSREFCLLI
jgi:hypothetical protein